MASLPYPRCQILCILCILWENSAPQPSVSIRAIRGRKDIPAERTEPSGREEPPTDEHGCSQIRRVWHPCHTHAAKFCVFCVFCGRTAHPNHLCQSVPSVGEKIFPQNARNLLAEKSLPQMSTDVHRLGGYGIPAIPTLPNSVYSVNSVGEQRTPTICVHPCHLWEVNAHQICCKKLCANPVICNANIVQVPST